MKLIFLCFDEQLVVQEHLQNLSDVLHVGGLIRGENEDVIQVDKHIQAPLQRRGARQQVYSTVIWAMRRKGGGLGLIEDLLKIHVTGRHVGEIREVSLRSRRFRGN